MLISDSFALKEIEIVISVINYGNEQDVIAFAQHLSEQTVAHNILLTITANKWSNDGQAVLTNGLQNIDLAILLLDEGRNLGYLNGTLLGYDKLRRREDFAPKWIAVSNTDIQFSDNTFMERLLEKEYAEDVGCLAPSVFVPATKVFENPRYKTRLSKERMLSIIKRCSKTGMGGLMPKLSAIKGRILRGAEEDSQYVYLAHGCFFFLTPELAEVLCEKPYGALLYTEESFVAETAITIGKRVYYDRSLKLYHNENAVTGKLGSNRREQLSIESINMVLDRFYHSNPCQPPYTVHDVCAVIVSYNDPQKLEGNVRVLEAVGVSVLIVDNGSNSDTVTKLNKLAETHDVSLLLNSENLGIATALQQGLICAKRNGYQLLLTLDQDSTLCGGAVEEMLRVMNSDYSIASVGPSYSVNMCAAEPKDPIDVNYLITSGNLVHINRAICCGGYDEDMFIDSVDFDFSLKLKQNGFRVVKAPGAHLRHSIGTMYRPKGLFHFLCLEMHSPTRYYYMMRNHVILCRRYRRSFPVFCLKKSISMTIEILQALLFFPNKGKYMKAINLGRKDAKNGKMGRLDNDNLMC